MVLESLAMAVFEAMLSLAGPIALGHVQARQKHKEVQYLKREMDRLGRDRNSDRPALALGLKEAGVPAEPAGEIWTFLNAPEGKTLSRFVVALTLGANLSEPDLTDGLEDQAEALLVLYRGSISPFASQIARPLAEELITGTRRADKALETTNPALRRTIRQAAIEQVRQPNSLTERALRTRAHAINLLASNVPTDVPEQVTRYASSMVMACADLIVPTMRAEDVVVKHDALYVKRRVLDETGEPIGEGIISALQDHKRLVVLGDPGGGKSTEINNLILTLARSASSTNLETVPFFVRLRSYGRLLENPATESTRLVDFLCDDLNGELNQELDANVVRYLLHTGRAAVCFDGLDEVLNLEHRLRVANRIQAFAGNFPDVNMVVTSRRIGYDSTPLGESFARVSLSPLSRAEMKTFATKFFHTLQGKNVDSSVADFAAQTESVDEIRRNPLMLGVLCSLYLAGRRMPKNRLEVYRDSSEMIFSAWDSRRQLYVEVNDEINTEAAVHEIAAEVFTSGEEDFPAEWARSFLESFYSRETRKAGPHASRFAQNALKAWRGRRWIIVDAGTRDGSDYFRFSHRTFLEYYAAKQVVYDYASSADVFHAIEPYVRARSGTVYCALAGELAAQRHKTAADEILSTCLASVSSSVSNDDLGSAYNILSYCFEILPALLRATPGMKRRLTWSAIDVLARLSIPVLVPEGRPEGWDGSKIASWPGLKAPKPLQVHRSVFDEDFESTSAELDDSQERRELTRDLADADTDEAWLVVSFEQVLRLLLAVDALDAEDQRDIAVTIGECLLEMAQSGDALAAHRVTYEPFSETFSEHWSESPFGIELQQILRGLIDRGPEFSLRLENQTADYWVLLSAIVTRGYVPESWLHRLNCRDLTVEVLGFRVSLIYVTLIDLLKCQMPKTWYALHPSKDFKLPALCAQIIQSITRTRIGIGANEGGLGWDVVDIPLRPIDIPASEKVHLLYLLALEHVVSGEYRHTPPFGSTDGVGRESFNELVEFVRYPLVLTRRIPGHEDAFVVPGLDVGDADAADFLVWSGVL